ncbi:tubulin epsilon chain isoform X3 [Siphateles boraxobius]|uniref:tubulin epsilon chain isoform X3 n=1 Tax=Siphateles boraxobius TaxID=180520 RepID=UPI0040641D18
MTQSIVVQVGQCGNQVGCRFWDLVLREHAHVNQTGVYDEALSSFFRNVDQSRRAGGADATGGRITALKARAVLVDMEEGVLGEILQGPLRSLFNSTQLISDVSGSGNNWAVGHHTYGLTYREQIVDQVRKAAEHCDCLQCFFLIHSMGGGTGSGLGTFVLKLLEEEFPEVCRIVTSVYPMAEDDVITSPYNSVLAMKELTEHADCVLPVDNQSLVDIVGKIQHMSNTGKPSCTIKKDCTIISGQGGLMKVEKPFDAMNNIVANLLLNITSSARFEGSLNMDLNEIAMNLVPFPRLHYLVPSLTPLYTLADVNVPPRRLKPTLPFVPWNQEGWKTSLCSVPPVCHSHSLLALANNTCVKSTFFELRERFVKLYRRKAHLHHYLAVDGMELAGFNEALSSISDLIEDYTHLEHPLMPNAPRLTIAT